MWLCKQSKIQIYNSNAKIKGKQCPDYAFLTSAAPVHETNNKVQQIESKSAIIRTCNLKYTPRKNTMPFFEKASYLMLDNYKNKITRPHLVV